MAGALTAREDRRPPLNLEDSPLPTRATQPRLERQQKKWMAMCEADVAASAPRPTEAVHGHDYDDRWHRFRTAAPRLPRFMRKRVARAQPSTALPIRLICTV
jgi:hypothetical protein